LIVEANQLCFGGKWAAMTAIFRIFLFPVMALAGVVIIMTYTVAMLAAVTSIESLRTKPRI
jgi:hypothetical protein